MNASQLKSGFPSNIAFPEELRKLCQWHEQHGYPISGGFELREHDDQSISLWFGSDAALGKLAVFGSGPDGSMYALWLQDNEECRVVHLGSEGQNNFVLARNMREFLVLLAIGYFELGFNDLSEPPAENDNINPEFRKWVSVECSAVIPSAGEAIVLTARSESEDFDAWIQERIG